MTHADIRGSQDATNESIPILISKVTSCMVGYRLVSQCLDSTRYNNNRIIIRCCYMILPDQFFSQLTVLLQ